MNFNFSNRAKGLDGTATREIFKLLKRPEIVSFAGGLPAGECIPTEEIRQISDEILSSYDAAKILQYGVTEGLPELKTAFKGYVENAGISVDYENDDILPVSGGQQAIDLMIKALANDGDCMLVENPTYLAVLQIAKSYNVKVVGVKANADGLDIQDLEEKIKAYCPKLLYIVPTFSNPTGKTYSEENRREIAALTAKYTLAVLEDDPYSRLRFGGNAVPPLKSFDKIGNVLYVTSLSKVLAPGLRVGAAVGDKNLIRKLAICKQGTDLHTSNLSQGIAAKYIESGRIYANIDKSLPVYKKRMNTMAEAIKKYMPHEFKCERPDGGLFFWGRFDCGIDTGEHLKAAVERNVAYIQGSVFYVNPDEGKQFLRLNFSNETLDRIDVGIKNLGAFYKEILSKNH